MNDERRRRASAVKYDCGLVYVLIRESAVPGVTFAALRASEV
jgi:hypothetical protein